MFWYDSDHLLQWFAIVNWAYHQRKCFECSKSLWFIAAIRKTCDIFFWHIVHPIISNKEAISTRYHFCNFVRFYWVNGSAFMLKMNYTEISDTLFDEKTTLRLHDKFISKLVFIVLTNITWQIKNRYKVHHVKIWQEFNEM